MTDKKTLRIYTYTYPARWTNANDNGYKEWTIKAHNKEEAMKIVKNRFTYGGHFPERLVHLGTENVGQKIRLGFLQKDALAFAYKNDKKGKNSVNVGEHNNIKDVYPEVSVATYMSLVRLRLLKVLDGYRFRITERGKQYYLGKIAGTYRGDQSYGNKYEK